MLVIDLRLSLKPLEEKRTNIPLNVILLRENKRENIGGNNQGPSRQGCEKNAESKKG